MLGDWERLQLFLLNSPVVGTLRTLQPTMKLLIQHLKPPHSPVRLPGGGELPVPLVQLPLLSAQHGAWPGRKNC